MRTPLTTGAAPTLYDSLLNFTDQQSAKNDPVLAAHMGQLLAWRGNYVLPGVQVWRVSQDTVTGTDPQTGQPIVQHTFLTGWNVLISLPQIAPALFNHTALRFMIDRARAAARVAGMLPKVNVTQAVMQDIMFSPVFAGADYPWGAWQI